MQDASSPVSEDGDGDNSHWDAAESTTLADSKPASPTSTTPVGDNANKPSVPMQKRRRVTRACDECRRKKIKCDGKQPCTHCTVYSYECSYDQPSNRRRNPAPQYIEALENRLQKAEAIVRSVLPGLDLDDPKYDARTIGQVVEKSKAMRPAVNGDQVQQPEDDARLQAMIEQTGSLDLDDQGYWDFHGHSSGFAFMRKLRSQFGESFGYNYQLPVTKPRSLNHSLESPRSMNSSPYDLNVPPAHDLPSREIAVDLCRNTLDDCCALMRFVHRATFFKRLHKVYDTSPDNFDTADIRFMPQLYIVLAIGCLFAKTENENTILDVGGYKEAMERGYLYFNAGRQMIDITDCRDLQSLQTICFMIVFLQSTAKLATCYAYIGVALRTCCRLGMHRNIQAPNQNFIEREERRRVFWLVRKMDTYVGTMLGLPQMLSDDDIDQEQPTEVADECIFEDGIKATSTEAFPLLKATNAHTRLTEILRKVIRYVYPVKGGSSSSGDPYTISHARIREIERDLQHWMDALPMELRPAETAGAEMSRVQQLLRMSYAHVQMMLYRPFIHYVSMAPERKAKSVDKRSYACAAACVSVARNIVHITSEMKRRGLLIGSYWFVMYTTYFAILSLVFFVLGNPDSLTSKEILKDAMEGRDTLAALAKRSLAADRCTHSLAKLFAELPEKMQERRSSLQSTIPPSRKRPQPITDDTSLQNAMPGTSTIALEPEHQDLQSAGRARTFPRSLLGKSTKRNSMPSSVHTPSGSITDASGISLLPPNGSMNYGTPSSTASGTGSTFFSQQPGDPSVSDLRAVMFPSDNPFAYPNQPMSTLEGMQYLSPEEQQEKFSVSTNETEFQLPNQIPGQMQTQLPPELFSDLNQPMYGNNNLGPQYQPGSDYSTSMGGVPSFPVANTEEVIGMSGITNAPEDYWSQMSRPGMRTGLTPGAVNLDELFGGDGWTNVWNEQTFSRP